MIKKIILWIITLFFVGNTFWYFMYDLRKPSYNPANSILSAQWTSMDTTVGLLWAALFAQYNWWSKNQVIDSDKLKNMDTDSMVVNCWYWPKNWWTSKLMKEYSSCGVKNFVQLSLETTLKSMKKYCKTSYRWCKDHFYIDRRNSLCKAFDNLTSRSCYEDSNWEPLWLSKLWKKNLKFTYDFSFKIYSTILKRLFPLNRDVQVEKLEKIIKVLWKYKEIYYKKAKWNSNSKILRNYLILNTLYDSFRLYYYKLTWWDNFEEIQLINNQLKNKTIHKKYDFNKIFNIIENIFKENYKCWTMVLPKKVHYSNEKFTDDDFYPFTKEQFLKFFKMQLAYYICFIQKQTNNKEFTNYLTNNVEYEINKIVPFNLDKTSYSWLKAKDISGMMNWTKKMYLKYSKSKLFRSSLIFLYFNKDKKQKTKVLNDYLKYTDLWSTFFHELSHLFQYYKRNQQRIWILSKFYKLCWASEEKQNWKCKKDDFIRKYGMTNQNEDWATVWETILTNKFSGIDYKSNSSILNKKISYYLELLKTYKK